jgi:hypothetical protein
LGFFGVPGPQNPPKHPIYLWNQIESAYILVGYESTQLALSNAPKITEIFIELQEISQSEGHGSIFINISYIMTHGSQYIKN